MATATILGPVGSSVIELPFFSSRVPAGFPSPAQDHLEQKLSLDQLLDVDAPHTFLVRAEPVHDEEGRILRWVGSNTDIEDRRNAELAARENEISFRGIVDSIPGLVFTTSASGETDFINQPLLDYFGRSLEELKGWVADGTIHPDDVPRVLDHWPRALQAGEPSEIELRLRRADGVYRWFQYRAIPARDDRGEILRWCVLATDIDDLKRAEEVLRATQARLSRAMQAASLSELSASIAHEINQPLAAISNYNMGSVTRLKAGKVSPEELLPVLEKVNVQAQRAGDVIRRIREFVKQQEPKRSPCPIGKIIEDAISFSRLEAKHQSARIEMDLPDALMSVVADPVLIEQVLMNLIKNGLEAMGHLLPDQKRIEIKVGHSAQFALIEVRDHGVGVPEEIRQRLFESFFTTKSDGMGMGLNICRTIIEYHQGQLWVEPAQGQGSVFKFTLPLAEDTVLAHMNPPVME